MGAVISPAINIDNNAGWVSQLVFLSELLIKSSVTGSALIASNVFHPLLIRHNLFKRYNKYLQRCEVGNINPVVLHMRIGNMSRQYKN
jgi:hypothetical protein